MEALEHLLEEPEDLSDCEPASCELVRAVPDGSGVIDVPVSRSSVVVLFPSVGLMGNLWNRSHFLSPKSVHIVVQIRGKSSDNASAFKKKDDAAHTCAKFRYLVCEGPWKVRRRTKSMECERKNNDREGKTVSGKKFQCEGEGGRIGRFLGPQDVDVEFR